MDGFAFTAEALTGRFAGSLDLNLLRRSRNALLSWSAGMAAAFFLIYCFFYSPIVNLITDSPTVSENITEYHIWLTLIPPLTVAAFIYDGFFIEPPRRAGCWVPLGGCHSFLLRMLHT